MVPIFFIINLYLKKLNVQPLRVKHIHALLHDYVKVIIKYTLKSLHEKYVQITVPFPNTPIALLSARQRSRRVNRLEPRTLGPSPLGVVSSSCAAARSCSGNFGLRRGPAVSQRVCFSRHRPSGVPWRGAPRVPGGRAALEHGGVELVRSCLASSRLQLAAGGVLGFACKSRMSCKLPGALGDAPEPLL